MDETVMVEFVRSASGADDRARVTRRYGAQVDAEDLDAAFGTPGYDLRWLVRLVPALLVAMAPGH